MCNCSKPLEETDLQRLRECNNDERTFIYYNSESEGLLIAYVPNGINPNAIALEREFPEWFSTKEHPLLNE